MRVAVVGCGSIGRRHIRNILALGHDVIAHDTDAGVVSRDDWPGGAEFVKHLPDALTVDALLICTPASTHAEMGRRIAAHGYRKALFVEKPIALSSQECDVFQSWPHPTTMVGYMLRHHYMARAMRAMFEKPVTGSFISSSDMSMWPGRQYASPMLEYSHEIDLALWCGAPSSVWYAEVYRSGALIRVGDWFVYLLWRASTYRREWSVSDGRMGYQHAFLSADELGPEMYVDEIAHFLDCAEKGIPTITPFADGLRVLDVCEQAERMACVR